MTCLGAGMYSDTHLFSSSVFLRPISNVFVSVKKVVGK